MRIHRRTCLRFLLAACVACHGLLSHAQDLNKQRQTFLEANRLLDGKQFARAEVLTGTLKDYPLYPYLRYRYLSARLEQVAPSVVAEFLDAYPGVRVAEKLRREWLRRLARNGQWNAYLNAYTPRKDTVLQCLELQARIESGHKDGVLEQAKRLWAVGKSQPDECDPVFAVLSASPLMTSELVQQRVRLAIAAGNTGLARYLTRRLPASERGESSLWLQAHDRPLAALQHRDLRADTPATREILVHGIGRLARQDARAAFREWTRLEDNHRFDSQEIGIAWKRIALAAVDQERAEANAWLDLVPRGSHDQDVQRAQLVTALKTRNWVSLVHWTETDPAPDLNPLRWRYWRARALESNGQASAAAKIFRELAEERDYYGFLAADRLGRAYNMQDRPIKLSTEQETALFAIPDMQRAREFYRVGLSDEARREWLFLIKRMSDDELRHAAVLAHRWGWHDMVILTLGRARAYDDLAMRFPLPYRDTVVRSTQSRGLEPALVYSIMRSESGFRRDARSNAGALGLMQLMPATGRLVARRIGHRLAGSRSLLDTDTNITLGSVYMRQMLERFGENIAMTAAAYNAGPGRVDNWRPEHNCTSADSWIELIPFRETRRYVRRILFYTVLYEWRMGQTITTISSRFADIPPRRRPQLSC